MTRYYSLHVPTGSEIFPLDVHIRNAIIVYVRHLNENGLQATRRLQIIARPGVIHLLCPVRKVQRLVQTGRPIPEEVQKTWKTINPIAALDSAMIFGKWRTAPDHNKILDRLTWIKQADWRQDPRLQETHEYLTNHLSTTTI